MEVTQYTLELLNLKRGGDVQPPRTKKYYRSTKSGAGMTAAGVAKYRRDNPGSKLRTAVTGKVKPGSKAAKRRKSFCARSAGQMKKFPKAAKDPNSRLRQARRRWKCQRKKEQLKKWLKDWVKQLKPTLNKRKCYKEFYVRRAILEALRAKYEAEIAEADATANIYLENSVGIGEHPQHIEEVNKLVEKIANAKEKLDVLDEFEPEKGTAL